MSALGTESPPASLRRSWRLLLVATFAIGFSNSVVFAVLADLQDLHGFGDAGLGAIAATGFAVSLAAQLLIAPHADRGRAPQVLRAGLVLAVAGSTAFAFASSLGAFVAARALVGASVGTFLPAARARAVLIAPTGRGERLGRLAGVELAGFVAGPFVGGLLVDPLGIRSTFLCFGAVALAALVGLSLSERRAPSPATPASGVRTDARPGWDLLRHPRILAGTLLAAAVFVPVGVFEALWDRFLTDLGASNQLIGLSFVMFGVPFVVFATPAGRLAERVGPLRCALGAALLLAPLIASYGMLQRPVVLVVLGSFEGTLQALAAPAVQLVVARATPTGREAAAQGLAGAAQLAAAALTAAGSAPLYASAGPGWVFVTAGALTVALTVTAALLARRTVSPEDLAVSTGV